MLKTSGGVVSKEGAWDREGEEVYGGGEKGGWGRGLGCVFVREGGGHPVEGGGAPAEHFRGGTGITWGGRQRNGHHAATLLELFLR